ncbi:MAG: gene transfer agent family protein [Robiginitomaculum sp.]|nr:gene transfer agent family protein [Robiginitomaculum sp.]
MTNHIRGETELLINGKVHILCLTLGALAEIEAGLDLGDSSQLSERLKKITAKDVLVLLAALLAGGGNPVSIQQLRISPLDPEVVAKAIADAFLASGK